MIYLPSYLLHFLSPLVLTQPGIAYMESECDTYPAVMDKVGRTIRHLVCHLNHLL